MGPGRVRPGAPREQADLPVGRLLDVPLVPRDGARELREPGDRRGAQSRYFVSIKVDREERPDVDRVYMTFVQATTGSGGWPMSVWLTPTLEPFYGGTYFPPEARWGRPGFVEILEEIARVWREEQPKVEQSAVTIIGTPSEHALDWRARRCSRCRRARVARWESSPRRSIRDAAASGAHRSFHGRASCCSFSANMREPERPMRETWRW